MKRLGKILHADKRGLVARAERAPRLGAKVHDQARRPIGRVSDVFGPTNSPYVGIKPTRGLKPEEIPGLKGGEVYIGGEPHGTKKERE